MIERIRTMGNTRKTIIKEIILSFVISIGSVIVLPQIFYAKYSPNYTIALVVFLAMSATFVGYETIFKKK